MPKEKPLNFLERASQPLKRPCMYDSWPKDIQAVFDLAIDKLRAGAPLKFSRLARELIVDLKARGVPPPSEEGLANFFQARLNGHR